MVFQYNFFSTQTTIILLLGTTTTTFHIRWDVCAKKNKEKEELHTTTRRSRSSFACPWTPLSTAIMTLHNICRHWRMYQPISQWLWPRCFMCQPSARLYLRMPTRIPGRWTDGMRTGRSSNGLRIRFRLHQQCPMWCGSNLSLPPGFRAQGSPMCGCQRMCPATRYLRAFCYLYQYSGWLWMPLSTSVDW